MRGILWKFLCNEQQYPVSRCLKRTFQACMIYNQVVGRKNVIIFSVTWFKSICYSTVSYKIVFQWILRFLYQQIIEIFSNGNSSFCAKNVVHVYEFQVYLHYRFFLILKIKFSDSVTCLFIKIVGSKLENGFERCICIEFKFHQRLIFAFFALLGTSFRCNFPF